VLPIKWEKDKKRGGESNMDFKKRLTTAVATGALLLNAFATPAFAATITISGNSGLSDSNAIVNVSSVQSVVQSNNATIVNNVDADADSGDNDANYNNGGNTTITTGSANTTVNVTNAANINTANVNCCPAANNITVDISDNGAFSDNNATLNLSSVNSVTQVNNALVTNNVDADADSGDNDANFNNGGDTSIHTGPASTNVTVRTMANANSATLGEGNNSAGSLVLKIANNSANSDSNIIANIAGINTLTQSNSALVVNDVDADADSGDNDANFNNGGDVVVTTGPATTKVGVDNWVNFNSADVSCGCLVGDWQAKILDNGFDSDQNIYLNLASVMADTQLNGATLVNDVDDADADSGGNDANYNNAGGAGVDTDPSVTTGPATSNVSVNNQSNVNTLGSATLPTIPGFPTLGVDFSLSWAFLLTILGL
jgi:hypothetical protein